MDESFEARLLGSHWERMPRRTMAVVVGNLVFPASTGYGSRFVVVNKFILDGWTIGRMDGWMDG